MDWQVNTEDNKPRRVCVIWVPHVDDWYESTWYDGFWVDTVEYRRIVLDKEVSHWAYVEGPGGA